MSKEISARGFDLMFLCGRSAAWWATATDEEKDAFIGNNDPEVIARIIGVSASEVRRGQKQVAMFLREVADRIDVTGEPLS